MKSLPLIAACALLATRALAVHCVGDCNGDGRVTVDEIVASVNIALGAVPLSSCNTGCSDNPRLPPIITCLEQMVNNALYNGCGDPTPTPTIEEQCGVGCSGPCYIGPSGPPHSQSALEVCPCTGTCIEFVTCGTKQGTDMCDDSPAQLAYCKAQLCPEEAP